MNFQEFQPSHLSRVFSQSSGGVGTRKFQRGKVYIALKQCTSHFSDKKLTTRKILSVFSTPWNRKTPFEIPLISLGFGKGLGKGFGQDLGEAEQIFTFSLLTFGSEGVRRSSWARVTSENHVLSISGTFRANPRHPGGAILRKPKFSWFRRDIGISNMQQPMTPL